jgi:hypothetical protein
MRTKEIGKNKQKGADPSRSQRFASSVSFKAMNPEYPFFHTPFQ